MTTEPLVVGVDIGGTTTEAVVTRAGVALASAVATTRPDRLTDETGALIERVIDEADAGRPEVLGVGIPGQVDPSDGTVRRAVNLGVGSDPLPLGPQLRSLLDVPVLVENDVVAAAAGAQRILSVDRELRDLAVINVGTGVSVGFVVDGRPLRGARGLAGELGQAVVDPRGGAHLESLIGGRSRDQAGADEIVVHLAWLAHWVALAVDVEQIALAGGPTERGAPFLDAVRCHYELLADDSPIGTAILPTDHIVSLPPASRVGPLGAAALALDHLGSLRHDHPDQEGNP